MLRILAALLTLISVEVSAGGGLGAVNDATVPVYQNIGGIGDYLIAPLYVANAGWSAELKIVNTSTVYSTVAKVIIHERSSAKEMLEFLVFLSPGDVWKGTIACNADGVNTCASLGVTSRDTDSLPQYAADANGRITISGKVAGGDIGYINVVESAAWALGAAPVNKTAIVAQHNRDLRAAGFTSGLTALAVNGNTPFSTYADAGSTGPTPFGFTGYAEVRNKSVASAENILAGNLRLTNSLNNASATLPLVAIANYRNARPLSTSAFTGIGNDEPTNASPCYTTLGALELALNNNDWLVPYDHTAGTTLASMTFPTRQTFDGILHGGSAAGSSNKISPGIYSFNNKSAAPVFASTSIGDEQENYISYSCLNSPCRLVYRPAISATGFLLISLGNNTTDDAGFLNIAGTGTFQAGWVNVKIDRQIGAPNAYPGAPAIVTAMQWSSLGNNLRAEWWYPQFKSTTGVSSND